MDKRMEDVNVYIGENGHVVLRQSSELEDDDVILLHPEQAEIVIKWIREAVKELREE